MEEDDDDDDDGLPDSYDKVIRKTYSDVWPVKSKRLPRPRQQKSRSNRYGAFSISYELVLQYASTKDRNIPINNVRQSFRGLDDEQQQAVKSDKIWQDLAVKFFDLVLEHYRRTEEEKKAHTNMNNNPNSFNSIARQIALRVNEITKNMPKRK